MGSLLAVLRVLRLALANRLVEFRETLLHMGIDDITALGEWHSVSLQVFAASRLDAMYDVVSS